VTPESKKDVVDTGLVAGVGGLTGYAGKKLLDSTRLGKMGEAAAFGVMTATGLVGDIAVVKAMHHTGSVGNTFNGNNTMNKVAKILIHEANELRTSTPELVALGLLKEAGLSDEDARFAVAQQVFEKQACEELTHSGIDMVEATKMVKAANIDVHSLESLDLTTNEERLANTLEKAAEYVVTLEARVNSLEEQLADQIEKTAQAVEASSEQDSDVLSNLASVGALTMEDVAALREVPEETLVKIARAVEQPWDIGHATGVERPQTDALLEFILS
jgi:hypothetical protein